MNDALDVGSGLMDGRVEHEARLVDSEVGRPLFHAVTLHVHFHQARCCHLAV